MRLVSELMVILLFMFLSSVSGLQAPTQPHIVSCRSPEKETFTCWWKSDDDRDLNTTYALYYCLEGSEKVKECPDYKTAGPNSCFFNKSDTSLWVYYNITVVATNSAGTSVSEPFVVDVANIVQPSIPEHVKVEVIDDEFKVPFLRVSWEKPQSADTHSGWVTLFYQLRIKQTKEDTWEENDAGMQKYYNIFSLLSGKEYMVQVRCKPDHGFWSEWTSPVYVQIPEYLDREHSVWILGVVFSAFFLLILTWTVTLKRNSVKHCLLPPVPGPKIKGFDPQLLKNGKSQEMFNSLVSHSFPPTNNKELLINYLEVYDDEETQDLILDSKDPPVTSVKSTSTLLDSNSGRGSCNSRTLLMDKSIEEKNAGWDSREHSSPIKEEEKAQNFENVSSLHQHTKQHFYQQNLLVQQLQDMTCTYHNSAETSCISSSAHINSTLENLLSKPGVCAYTQLDSMGAIKLESTNPQFIDYIEVQKVDQENGLHAQPLSEPVEQSEDHLDTSSGENYSKVQDVISENLLLLQRDLNSIPQSCGDYYCQPLQKENHQICKSNTLPSSSSILPLRNEYVDSTMMIS